MEQRTVSQDQAHGLNGYMPQQEVTKSGQNLFFTYPDPLDAAKHKQGLLAFPFRLCFVLHFTPFHAWLGCRHGCQYMAGTEPSKGPHVDNLLYIMLDLL